ncbi:MAG: hypothetical protein JNL67_15455 [Planctomycetaceae bacterium]|nr:hypothetical protein [Planctomycetaceae bacterium]
MISRFAGRIILLYSLAVVVFHCVTIVHGLGQELTVVERQSLDGKILAKTNHSLVVQTDSGSTISALYQDAGVRSINLSGDGGALRLQTTIRVLGELPMRLLRPGMAVEVELDLAKDGNVGSVRSWKLLPVDHDQTSLVFAGVEPQNEDDFQPAVVQAIVTKHDNHKIALQLPKSEFTSKAGLILTVHEDAKLLVAEQHMQEVQAGDEVVSAELLKLNTGDWVVQQLEVRLATDRPAIQTEPEQVYQLKYRHLSNEPESPRELRSKNFLIKTDLSPRSAQILLDKLEDMFAVVSKYYNRRTLGQPIVCYVVGDLNRWGPATAELTEGLDWIRRGAGVTLASRLGNLRRAIVYSCGEHSIVQHEAVHAFCHLAYGGTGPTWYAEGMAELGCYWRTGDVGVNIDPVVIRYLTTTSPKPLSELVRLDQVTGDSWQAYAWRWALCYMLVNNPNYGQRFFRLGEEIMPPDGKATFQSEFANVASEISFEYEQFVKHLGNGYQQELCSWDWKTKAIGVDSRGKKSKVVARRGWQAAGALVKAGETYRIQAEGAWTTDGRDPFSADGLENGTGRLIGAILSKGENREDRWAEYQLSEEFQLGEDASFSAPATGNLYLRCQEPLTQIGDNQGELKVTIRKQ